MLNFKLLKYICGLKESKLKNALIKYLFSIGYKKVYYKEDYILAEGTLPICLVAHMDTVFSHYPQKNDFFYDNKKKVLWSPHGTGFDDRAGIYAIIHIIGSINDGSYPSIIFTDKEEVGGIGAYELIKDFPQCPFDDCRCIIELDRANEKDCVFYNCDNHDFERFISRYGFKYEFGSFSDISIIAPSWGIAAVNLSIGYEDEHTSSERLHTDWCEKTIKKVQKILKDSPSMMNYAYIPFVFKNTTNVWHVGEKHNNIELKTCLLCGKDLTHEEGVQIYDPEYPYLVCKDCYKEYYDDKGNYLFEQIPFN